MKAHYAGISAARLKPTPLGEDRKAYVSYRVRNEVFWTSKPVSLRKGEIVLTDGENLVRGRCGNRISDTPQLPVASVVWEPDEEALNPSGIDELPVPGSLIRGWESEPSASSQPLVMATLSSPGQAGGESAALGWTPGSPFAALYGTAASAGVGGGGGAGGGVAPGGGGGGGGSSGSAITFAGSQDTFARQAPLILYAGNQFNAGYQSIAVGYERQDNFENWSQVLRNGGFTQVGAESGTQRQTSATYITDYITERLPGFFYQYYGESSRQTTAAHDNTTTVVTSTTTTVIRESFETIVERVYECCTDCGRTSASATPEPGAGFLAAVALVVLALYGIRLRRRPQPFARIRR